MDKKCHSVNIFNEFNDFSALADQLANLRYDCLSNFLYYLYDRLEHDARADQLRNRKQLSQCLRRASEHIAEAHEAIHAAWSIAARYEMADGNVEVCPECGGKGFNVTNRDWFTACGLCVNLPQKEII